MIEKVKQNKPSNPSPPKKHNPPPKKKLSFCIYPPRGMINSNHFKTTFFNFKN